MWRSWHHSINQARRSSQMCRMLMYKNRPFTWGIQSSSSHPVPGSFHFWPQTKKTYFSVAPKMCTRSSVEARKTMELFCRGFGTFICGYSISTHGEFPCFIIVSKDIYIYTVYLFMFVYIYTYLLTYIYM